jgi:hypothetical protein
MNENNDKASTKKFTVSISGFSVLLAVTAQCTYRFAAILM